MLTPAQVIAVSRSIIGHMTTDPTVRDKMDIDPSAPGADASLADTINAATSFSPPVTPEDVPAILASIKSIGEASEGLEPLNAVSNVLFFKSS